MAVIDIPNIYRADIHNMVYNNTKAVLTNAAKIVTHRPDIPPHVKDAVINNLPAIEAIILSDGRGLVDDFLLTFFNSTQWNIQQANDIIIKAIERIAHEEIFKHGIQIVEFDNSANWIKSYHAGVLEYARAFRTQPQAMNPAQQPYGSGYQYSGQQQPYMQTNAVNNAPLQSSVYTAPINPYANSLANGDNLISQSPLAAAIGETMQRENHVSSTAIPNPTPDAFEFNERTVTQNNPLAAKKEHIVPIKNKLLTPEAKEHHILSYKSDEKTFNDDLVGLSDITMPTLTGYFSETIIPGFDEQEEDAFKNALDSVISADSLVEMSAIFKEVSKNVPESYKTIVWFANNISDFIINTMDKRYGINDAEFLPFIGNPVSVCQYLSNVGALEDMSAIIEHYIDKLVDSIVPITIRSYSDKEIPAIMISKYTEVIFMPYLFKYLKNSKALKCLEPGVNEEIINDLFDQAFALLPPAAVCVEMLDQTYTRYKVWRLGKPIMSPCEYKYSVELM